MSLAAVLVERMNAPSPELAIQRACAYALAETGQQAPPIELRKILSWLDVPVVYLRGDDSVGHEIASVSYDHDRPSVVISNREFRRNRGRARFSIAHEIGHLLIMKIAGVQSIELGEKSKKAYQEMERLCDLAASHLLVPREYITASLRHGGIRSRNIRRMQRLFDVSETALLRAIAETISGSALVDWRRFSRSDREVLAWRVFRCFGSSSADKNRPWLPIGSSMKHLQMEVQIDDLKLDEPVVVSRADVIFGRRRCTYEGVVCMWDGSGHRSTNQVLLQYAENEAAIRADGTRRLIVVLGPRSKFDSSLLL